MWKGGTKGLVRRMHHCGREVGEMLQHWKGRTKELGSRMHHRGREVGEMLQHCGRAEQKVSKKDASLWNWALFMRWEEMLQQ